MSQNDTNTEGRPGDIRDHPHRRDLLHSRDAEPRRDCKRCSKGALPRAALCEECYGRITEDLCTSQVLERFTP
jgi:uncharacterized OB-fold protein